MDFADGAFSVTNLDVEGLAVAEDLITAGLGVPDLVVDGLTVEQAVSTLAAAAIAITDRSTALFMALSPSENIV